MIGLVLEGGGMRAGFVAGAVMALMDKGLLGFDCAVAVSAGAPTLAYMAAGQRREMESVWREELCSPGLIRYRHLPLAPVPNEENPPVVDVDYLVLDLFREKYPLDVERLLSGPIQCHFATAELSSGRFRLLRPGDDGIYKILKAAVALPGCYPHGVSVNGVECIDGGTVNPLPVYKLIGLGAERLVAILSRPVGCEFDPPSLLGRALFWWYFQKHAWILDKLEEAGRAYEDQVLYLAECAAQSPAEALVIAPDSMPPARLVTRSRRKINRAVDMGYEKVEEMQDHLRRFFHPATAPQEV